MGAPHRPRALVLRQHVQVREPPRIPTGINGGKPRNSLCIGGLHAPQESHADRVRAGRLAGVTRIHAVLVALPDVDCSVRNRFAVRIDDAQPVLDRHAWPAFGDVLPEQLAVEVERALGDAWRKHAGGGGCRRGRYGPDA